MKSTKLFFLTLLFLTSIGGLFAQESDEEREPIRFSLSGAYGMIGASVSEGRILTSGMVDKLGYGAHIINLNPTPNNYVYNFGNVAPYMSSANFVVGLEFSPQSDKKQKLNANLRIGMVYTQNNFSVSGRFTRSDLLGRTVVDTVIWVGDRDTNLVYRDSMGSYTRNIRYANDYIAFDASYVLRSNPKRSISFHGGLGFSPGIIINAVSSVTGEDRESSELATNLVLIQDQRNGKVGFLFNFYIPLGVNFRLSKKNEFFKNVYVFSEIRPSVSFQYVPEFGGSTRVFSQNMAGIRAVFN